MRRVLRIASALLAMITFIGPVHSQDRIKIGVIQPLTGAFAASGNYVATGARIAAEKINASGGVLGKQLELVVEDNKSNPTEAASAAEKLIIRDKVAVLLGAWGSSLTLAAMPKLQEYKVPMVVETSAATKITTSGNPYVFRIAPTSAMEAEFLKTKLSELKITRADFLVVNNDWGRGTVDDLKKMFQQNNVAVGLVETIDPAAQDMGAQLAKIKSSPSDVLIVTAAVEQLTLMFKQAAALSMKKRIITTGGSQNPDQIIAQAGPAANGSSHLTTFTPWVPDATPFPALTSEYIAAWKQSGLPFPGITESFRGFDAVRTIAAAITKAGRYDSEAIRQALWSVQVEGLVGRIQFAKVGPTGSESGQARPDYRLIMIQDEKVRVLQ